MKFEWDTKKTKSNLRKHGAFIKKPKPQKSDKLRREYKRSDFGPMVRGKYAKRIATTTNIVILEPEIAKAFPNDKIVNDTLRSLLRLATTNSRPPRTKKRRASA